jgi:acyl carrier protein
MTLPKAVLDFLNHNAQESHAEPPEADDDLFKAGILDSFTLVEFASKVEEECGVKVPDADVNAQNFRSIAAIECYVQSLKS